MAMYTNGECSECGFIGLCIVTGDECYCETCCETPDLIDDRHEAEYEQELDEMIDLDPYDDPLTYSYDDEFEIDWSEYENFDHDFNGVYH